jgi:hypothetical protein
MLLMKSLRLLWFIVPVLLALGTLYGVLAYLKKKERSTSYAVDHIQHGPPIPSKRLVHGSFSLGQSRRFSFVVPPHVMGPHLYGEFSSSVRGAGGATLRNQSADVALLLLNEAQYQDFLKRRSTQPVYASDPSHDQRISIALPGTLADPVTYYVIFQPATDPKTPVSVNADLTVEFQSSM